MVGPSDAVDFPEADKNHPLIISESLQYAVTTYVVTPNHKVSSVMRTKNQGTPKDGKKGKEVWVN